MDYLVVAAAALRCGACFTALLYLEHHCEAEHGRLVLGDDQPLAAVRPFTDARLPMTACARLLRCSQSRYLSAERAPVAGHWLTVTPCGLAGSGNGF